LTYHFNQLKTPIMVTAQELANALGDFVNYSSARDKNKQFCEAFSREHRTLQQSAFRLMLELIEHIASDEYSTDGRNEATKQMAQTLLKGFRMAKKEEYLAEGLSEARAESYVTGDGEKPSRYLPFI